MTRKIVGLLAAASLLAVFITGCGGSSSGSSAPATPITLSGKLVDGNGAAVVGDKIDVPSSSASTTSLSGGAFTLQLPPSTFGTVVSLYVYNGGNQLVLAQSYSIEATSGQTQALGTIVVGPPSPPA